MTIRRLHCSCHNKYKCPSHLSHLCVLTLRQLARTPGQPLPCTTYFTSTGKNSRATTSLHNLLYVNWQELQGNHFLAQLTLRQLARTPGQPLPCTTYFTSTGKNSRATTSLHNLLYVNWQELQGNHFLAQLTLRQLARTPGQPLPCTTYFTSTGKNSRATTSLHNLLYVNWQELQGNHFLAQLRSLQQSATKRGHCM